MTSRPLTIYLLKASITDPLHAIRESADVDSREFHVGNLNGVFFARRPDPHPTEWLDFVEPVAGGLLDGAEVSSMGCLVILPSEDRLFALAFGTGWSFISPHAFERNFGLKVVANAIDDGQLRVLDARSLDAVSLNQRMQTSRRSAISDFGMNLDRDMLTGVTGSAQSAGLLGKTIAGRDSLKIRRDIEWDDFGELLRELLLLWDSELYRDSYFAAIDHFGIVRDKELLQSLDERLQREIENGDAGNLCLAVPEMIAWENPIFKYQKPRQGAPHEDIDWETYVDSVDEYGIDVTIELMKRQSVHCFIGDDDKLAYTWPVYSCLYVELVDGEDVFVLSSGAWCKIAGSYIESVNHDVMTIPGCSLALSATSLPDEDQYIDIHTGDNNPGYRKMHKEMISHGGGHGSIEFCDILSPSRHLIHIKRHGRRKGPEALSHLFSQGVVSSQLMMSDTQFRQKVNTKLQVAGCEHLFEPHTDRLNGRDWEVVFVIIHHAMRSNDSLPLLSRINLRNAASRIRSLGMSVSTLHVLEQDGTPTENQAI